MEQCFVNFLDSLFHNELVSVSCVLCLARMPTSEFLRQPLLQERPHAVTNNDADTKSGELANIVDRGVLSLLSAGLERKRGSNQARESSNARLLRALRRHAEDQSGISAIKTGWFVELCPTCPAMRAALAGACSCVGVWDKPLLLVTNAMNYLWFLSCFNIFTHYKVVGSVSGLDYQWVGSNTYV